MPTASRPPRPIAFLCHTLPPGGGGQAIALSRLLADLEPAAFRLVTSARRPAAGGGAFRAAGAVPQPWLLRKLRRIGPLQPMVFRRLVAARARRVARLLERERCAAIVGCTGGDLVDIPAAVAAARLAGVPAFLYYFDDYRHQWLAQELMWRPQVARQLGPAAEAAALAGAAGIIVPNESLADEVSRRTAAPITIVRNPVDTAAYAACRGRATPAPSASRRIVYTGAVYEAQASALRNAARAVDLLRAAGHDIALHLYTPDSQSRLEAQGIPASVTVHPAVSASETAAIQTAADILLLPLSFSSSYPDLIRTSSPGKLGEYLAAGRPLLVHGPNDSFPVRFVARNGCGAVGDVDDAVGLAAVIARLLEDREWAASLARRAVAASEAFALATNRALLTVFVGLPATPRHGRRTGAA